MISADERFGMLILEFLGFLPFVRGEESCAKEAVVRSAIELRNNVGDAKLSVNDDVVYSIW